MSNPTVKEMTMKWLEANGYDGLYHDDCGCGLDDLMPCTPNDGVYDCEAGYKVTCTDDCTHEREKDFTYQSEDWHIQPSKPQTGKGGVI